MASRRKFSNQKKSLGVNCIQRIIKFKLLMQTEVKVNSYLRINVFGQSRFPLILLLLGKHGKTVLS